ncbi:hypothetical protein GKZ28_23120 [Clostridium chromiireducens]|uniref:Uncharacterized protein n=1 Tax=Clostridium chromiireducens TaxID=225345 RepID=A0A964W4N7_9CLOT|nr:hypothetical protein [Clostridium chromiireducens]MVX66564.1 hypothetical protein [Clostridium chromiireducens]
MPKLSKTRIINLTYNDGKRTIYNEVFDYGQGKDTLFSMENGIGKTVLIQFFLQPFIRNKRELAGRKFEDYFSGSAPAYILHEVILDNEEKLLVGMIIKKDSSEEEKNKLRILTFLNRYNKPNDFDIINAPFLEGKRILKFSEAEEKIKKYKGGKVNFKFYNFNDSSKKSQYFEDLRAYKLNYKEWEDIIRIINNDESGLSNLYDKHKTDEALIRNVIIPLIESKINGEKNIIEGIRNNLSKYVETFKQSKEAFYEVDLLKSFKVDTAPVIEMLKEGILKEEERDTLYKKLSIINAACEEEFTKKCSEKLQCEEFYGELKNELQKVRHEEHSFNYYNLQDKKEEKIEKLDEVTEKYKKFEDKHKDLVRERFIQESAEAYEEFLDIESSLAEVKERIANYEREDTEIAKNIRDYSFTLKNIYESELGKLSEENESLLDKQKEAKIRFDENQKKQRDIIDNKITLSKAEENEKNKIRAFEKIETQFRAKYTDFQLMKNLLFTEYDAKELENYGVSIEEKTKANIDLQEKLKADTTSLIAKKEDIRTRISKTNDDIISKREALIEKKNELDNFNKETEKILEILRIKNLPLKVAKNKQKLKDIIQTENLKFQDTLIKENEKLREAEETVNRYETGLIKLPKDVISSFENKGIKFEYALSWLQNYKGSKEEKEKLVKGNPFFPYGIILSAKDINLLKSESIDVYTSVPIPIINQNELNKSLKLSKNSDILTIENADFLLSFNNLLLDEEERLKLLNNLRKDINIIKYEITSIQNAVKRNDGYALNLSNYTYFGNEDEAIKKDINALEASIKELESVLTKYNEESVNNENRRESILKDLHELDKNLTSLKEQKIKFNEFITQHDEYKKSNVEVENLQKLIKDLKKKELDLDEERIDLRGFIENTHLSLYELKNSMEDAHSKLELYKDIQQGTIINEDKNILEAKLSSCKKQLGDDITRDKQMEETLSKNLLKTEKRLKRIAKDGNLNNEYKKVRFSEQMLEELKEQIETFQANLHVLEIEVKELEKQIGLIEDRIKRVLEDILKLGFEIPISKEKIKDSNFKDRERKINKDLNENGNIIKAYEDEINKLNLIKQKLDSYKNSYSNRREFKFDFNNLVSAEKIINEHISNYESIKKDIFRIESKILNEVTSLHEKFRDKNRFIKERLFDYIAKERKILSHSDIESLIEIVDRKISTLEIELTHIKTEEEVVINDILRYSKHILEELKTIDKKSNIRHLGKTQKLLEISIPDEIDEENLKIYIRQRVDYYSNFEEDYLNLLESDIQSAELLSKLIGNINRIRVDIKKIEKTGLIRKNWKEALSQNSGGEKFVSMFILLSSLMSYMRKRETDIDNKEEKKILIMDNPFAKTNAEHLLEPMFQIAEKYNIQLICFSGIGGSSVYNRFDKIYVAKVIEDKFRNKENVTFKAGSEETLELSDFTITKEQISLF